VKQRTIQRRLRLEGIGLESGKKSVVILHPERENYGIRFYVDDYTIPAHFDYVVSTTPSVTLGVNDIRVHTVEHLLSILNGLGITNLTIEVLGDEIPENTKEFAHKISREAVDQKALSCQYHFSSTLFESDRTVIRTFPSYRFTVSCFYSPDFVAAKENFYTIDVRPENYLKQISWAKTFCTESYLNDLQVAGMAMGAMPSNCRLVGDGYAEEDRELVRHKILDFIGDISLAGMSSVGHFVLTNPSHEKTIDYLKSVFRRRHEQIPSTFEDYGHIQSSNGAFSYSREASESSGFCEI